MIVNRRMFIAKKGCQMEAAQLFKAEVARVWPNLTARFYTSNFGPFDALVAEAEHQSLAEYERIIADGMSRISPEFWGKWNELTETGGTNEIWNLV